VRKFKLAKQLQFFKTGRPYTKAHFDEYRKLFGDDLARNALREMLPEIQHLVMEAVKAGPAGIKNRLPALQFDFYEWVSEVEAKFKIAPLPSQRCFA